MILTIGLSCYDQFFFIKQFPEENQKEFAYDFLESGGGPCGNASYLLGKWGEKVQHITTLKPDNAGQSIIKELQDVGVSCKYSLINEQQVTPLSSILINNKNASRTIITHKNLTIKTLSEEYRKNLDIFVEHLNSINETIVILIDGHEFEISEYIIPKIKNKIVVMDAGNYKESLIKLAKYTNYLVSSETFASSIINNKSNKLEENDYEKALIELKKISVKSRENIPVITLGDRGVIYLEKNKVKHIPSYHCFPIDTTGAGDIFHGAFVYGISYKWDLERVVKFSALTAAMSIEKKGVREAMPDFYQVEYNLLNNIYKTKI